MKVKEYFVFSVQSVCAFNEKQTIKTAGLSLKLKFQSYSKDTFDRFLLISLYSIYSSGDNEFFKTKFRFSLNLSQPKLKFFTF